MNLIRLVPAKENRSLPAAIGSTGILPVCFIVSFFMTSLLGASVSGVVRDAATGQALSEASVSLAETSGQRRFASATRLDGTFVFSGVQPGNYRLHVSHLGYSAHEATVEVAPGQALELDVGLSANARTQTEVIVTATRAQVQLNPVSISNLVHRDIEERGAMKDLPVLLAELPSTTYYSENGNGIGYSTMSLRGFDQRRLAVTINGIPQNDPEDHNVFWINFFDLQGAVSDIQVQRGAGSSLYGSAGIGGAIDIVALPYRPYRYAKAHIGYGSLGTQRYTVESNSGLLNNKFVLFGRYSRLFSDGYRDWSWTRFDRFFLGGVWYGKSSTLTVQGYGGPQRDGLAFSGISKAANADDRARRFNFSRFSRDIESFHQPHVELLHDWRLAPSWTLNQALFWVKGEGYFDFGATFRSADYLNLPESFRGLTPEQRKLPLFISAPDVPVLFRAYLDQWQIGWLPKVTRKHATGETTLGGEVRLHRSLRWGRIQEAAGIPADRVGSRNDARVYQFRGEKLSTSIFAHHVFRPVEWLAVQSDLQLSHQHYRNFDERFFGNRFRVPYTFVNPRIGVTVNPDEPVSAYASFAVASREPRLKQLYDGEEAGAGFKPQFHTRADGSLDYDRPLVGPERLFDLEMGGAIARERYRMSANMFLMQFGDEIVPSGGLDQFGVPRTGNAERTRHVGFETEAATRVGGVLDLSANLTYSRNRFLRFVEYVSEPGGRVLALDRAGNPIAGFPEWVINARAAYRWRGVLAAIDAKRAGKQYIDNSRGRLPDGRRSSDLELAPYTLLNLSASYDLPEHSALAGLRLSFNIDNLLNRKILLYGNVGPLGPQFFPLATRHFFASLQYTLH